MSGELKGLVSISYPTGYEEDIVNLTLIDEASGKQIADIRIPFVEFTRGLSGRYGRPCRYELYNLDKVGKKHEWCDHVVPGRFYGDDAESILHGLCAKFETDGWVADVKGALSVQQGPNSTSVTFHRFLDV